MDWRTALDRFNQLVFDGAGFVSKFLNNSLFVHGSSKISNETISGGSSSQSASSASSNAAVLMSSVSASSSTSNSTEVRRVISMVARMRFIGSTPQESPQRSRRAGLLPTP